MYDHVASEGTSHINMKGITIVWVVSLFFAFSTYILVNAVRCMQSGWQKQGMMQPSSMEYSSLSEIVPFPIHGKIL